MIIADTSGLLAFFNSAEPAHGAVSKAVQESDHVVVSPYVIAELDYLLATRVSVAAELAALSELAGGAYLLAEFGEDDLRVAAEVIDRFRDQSIGVADASLVVLAGRYETNQILTLDRRHFEVLRPLDGTRFDVLPRTK
jgi:predicted nucleic acid-binding protein